jgi:hypothetical protein
MGYEILLIKNSLFSGELLNYKMIVEKVEMIESQTIKERKRSEER